MALTADQIGFYQDNGYLLLEQAIPSSVLTNLRNYSGSFHRGIACGRDQ